MVVSKQELKAAHKRYDEALSLKSDSLPAHDRWYRSELTTLLQQRHRNEKGAFLTSEELVKLMKWKLSRGKFRPRLEQLAQSNPDEFVHTQTKKAFEIISSNDSLQSAKEGILVLNTLKGIGPATSSAILAAFLPQSLSFMSDEALEAAVGLVGKPKYSVSEWQWFNEQMQERVKEENWKGGTQELEEAAWAYIVFKRNGIKVTPTTNTEDNDESVRATKKKRPSSTSLEGSSLTNKKKVRKEDT